jgi:uncharacterized protein YjbI with pentapeptide repeats
MKRIYAMTSSQTLRYTSPPLALCVAVAMAAPACLGYDEPDPGSDGAEDGEPQAGSATSNGGLIPTGTPGNTCGGTDANQTSRCARPDQPASYYLGQASTYFGSLDPLHHSARPNYDGNSVRYEWAPWWGDDGWGNYMNKLIDTLLVSMPATVKGLKCRYFDKAPYARCYVNLSYGTGDVCPIYEEFTFLPGGKMSFVEAWTATKKDAVSPFMPQGDANLVNDLWGENDSTMYRSSTKYPGLGQRSGLGGSSLSAKQAAAAGDPAVKQTMTDTSYVNPVKGAVTYLAALARKFAGTPGWNRGCFNTKKNTGNSQELWDKPNGWFYTGECLRYFTRRSDQPMSRASAQTQCNSIKAKNVLSCFDEGIWSYGSSYPSAATAQRILDNCSVGGLRSCSQPGNGATGDYTRCNLANRSGWVVNWFSLNLSYSDLSNADLSGQGRGGNFQHVNFSHAKLVNVKFDHGNLQSPNFSFANLTGATFTGANKQGIVFSHTTCPDGNNSGASGTCVLR